MSFYHILAYTWKNIEMSYKINESKTSVTT